MGKHSAPEERPKKNSLTDTTLTTLKKIFHMPTVSEKDKNVQPRGWGIGDDEETTVWLETLTEDKLPFSDVRGHENWEYRINIKREGNNGFPFWDVLCGGYYGIERAEYNEPDSVAFTILESWLDWNSVDQEIRLRYAIDVRKLGTPDWNGYAEGRA